MARRAIFSICLDPKVNRALAHYIRVLLLDPEPLPAHFGRSTAINDLLRISLRRKGFDPDRLRLIGERR